jgi:hypothetical protein
MKVKQGDRITFWSERVLGVPVDATVLKVGRVYIHVEAWHNGTSWKGRIHPGRMIEVKS